MLTSLEVISLLTPFVVLGSGFLLNRKLKLMEEKNEAHIRQELEEKDQERNKLERHYALRIEFRLDAAVYKPQNGFYLVEFITTINNKSLIRHEFTEIKLRILGIKKDENIELWKNNRISFPEKLGEENIIPWNYVLVEPDITQELTYTTRIPEDISFILVNVEFHYDATTPHTAEKMFALQAPRLTDMTNEI